MYKKKLLLIIFLHISIVDFSQNNKELSSKSAISPSILLAKTTCDCKTAVKINLDRSKSYGPTNSPRGFGTVQEIVAKNKTDKTAFEQEHNSSWYLIDIQHDGELVFDIMPEDSISDYDFMLYKYTDTSFCSALRNRKIIPVRGNLSRNNFKTLGITGLSHSSKNDFTEKGLGDVYSRAIEVKTGEKYMLVLDNLSSQGKGHTIFFSYMMQAVINGIVTNFKDEPIQSEIILMDGKEKVIAQTNSDATTGGYHFSILIKEGIYYGLIFNAADYFFQSADINTKHLKPDQYIFNVNKKLQNLSVGNKYPVMYCSYGGQIIISTWADVCTDVYAIVQGIKVFMQKNPTIKLRIEVHADEDATKNWEKGQNFEDEEKFWNSMNSFEKKGMKNHEKGKTSLAEWRAFHLAAAISEMKGMPLDRIVVVAVEGNVVIHPKTDEEKKQNGEISIKVMSN